MKVVFLSNMMPPYQKDVLESLRQYADVRGYFLYKKELNRDYILETPEYCTIADFKRSPRDYLRYLRFVSNEKPSSIIVGGYGLPLCLTTILACKFLGIKLYFWLERPINSRKGITGLIKKIYIQIMLKNATKIFCIGKLAELFYSQFHQKVINLPYAMRLADFYEIERNYRIRAVRFLSSGQFIDRKNLISLINAFKKITDKDIRLTLIGSGELKDELESLCSGDERIKIDGFKQRQELPSVYKENDVFVLPSKHDGWALVINEAMASSMPIISNNNVGAFYEFIDHGVNGFDCGIDEEGIKVAIEFYIRNRNEIKIQGDKNRDIIKRSKADVEIFSAALIREISC